MKKIIGLTLFSTFFPLIVYGQLQEINDTIQSDEYVSLQGEEEFVELQADFENNKVTPMPQEVAKQTYINYDIQYIQSLEGKDEKIIADLNLNDFQSRFAFLNANTSLHIDYNQITYNYVRKYLTYRWYGRLIGLSNYYFPLFEMKLRQYGLPPELKYLAVVESTLNPRAGSSVGAGGIWQFMPATGAEYGLWQNQHVSLFYDPMASTDAACRYLKKAYGIFKDWNLAISSYNCGAGNVLKAMRRAGSRNYWEVRPYLPAETQAYVPSFIAVNYMFNFYDKHGIKPTFFKYSFLQNKIVKINTPTYLSTYPYEDKAYLRFANPHIKNDYIPAGSVIYLK